MVINMNNPEISPEYYPNTATDALDGNEFDGEMDDSEDDADEELEFEGEEEDYDED